MATVKGQNLRIFLGNADPVPFAAALQCTLEIQMNVQPYSTKEHGQSIMCNLYYGT